MCGNYYVVSDDVELTPRQYAATREQMRQTVLASESIRQMVAVDLQFVTEKEIVHTMNNFLNFRRDRAVPQRGVAGQTFQGQYYQTSELVRSERAIALNALNVLFGQFRLYKLTPDGFVR